jgi:hypothetical protein
MILEHDTDGLCPKCENARWMNGGQGYCKHQHGHYALVAFGRLGGERQCDKYKEPECQTT